MPSVTAARGLIVSHSGVSWRNFCKIIFVSHSEVIRPFDRIGYIKIPLLKKKVRKMVPYRVPFEEIKVKFVAHTGPRPQMNT